MNADEPVHDPARVFTAAAKLKTACRSRGN